MKFKIQGFYGNSEIKISVKLPSFDKARELADRLKLNNYTIKVLLDEN